MDSKNGPAAAWWVSIAWFLAIVASCSITSGTLVHNYKTKVVIFKDLEEKYLETIVFLIAFVLAAILEIIVDKFGLVEKLRTYQNAVSIAKGLVDVCITSFLVYYGHTHVLLPNPAPNIPCWLE
ncbi:hypothetical protein ACHQM5_017569 [Ranunculus cassubicifolius]